MEIDKAEVIARLPGTFNITSRQRVIHNGEEDEDDIDSAKSDEETVKEGGDLYSWDDNDGQNVTK